ncbi:MAG: Glutamate-cysteine ligase family [Labilithrix sp.]|nr:Glutamate-cysteine ligase family [Labilithrix sp.]
MGFDIERERFEERDYELFSERLRRALRALEQILRRPGFGVGPVTIGTELELHLVGEDGRPAPVNRAVLAAAVDERVTLEMDRFNVEVNSPPMLLAGRPFAAMAADLTEAVALTRAAARTHGADVVMVGILPTLMPDDLLSSALTDRCRYRALSAGIRRERGEPAMVRIEGADVLEVSTDDVTFEGANTSFQVHLRVDPERFARTYNAAQIATAFVLAIAGNSPLFLHKRLWAETRVALFRQAVEDRCSAREDDWRPSRVSFGHGWVRTSASELFAESVNLHAPLLPQCSPEDDPEAVVRDGGVPHLRELRLQHGTVWRWNRAVYDHTDGGHLRIEMRALPAGPTIEDMVANAALAIGLTMALADEADALVTRLTFGQTRRSFYDAARLGLGAEILWPCERAPSPRACSPVDLASRLIPMAREGLVRAGVEPSEADSWLGVIEERVARGRTGAVWQRRLYEELTADVGPEAAARAMLRRYRELSDRGGPVAGWPER